MFASGGPFFKKRGKLEVRMAKLTVFWTIVSTPHNYWRRYAIRESLFTEESAAHCFLVNPTSYTRVEAKAHGDICLSSKAHVGYDTVDKTFEQIRRLRRRCEWLLFSDDDAFVDIRAMLSNVATIARELNHTNAVYGSIEWSSIDPASGRMNGWGYSPSSSLYAKTRRKAAWHGPFPFMKGPAFVLGADASEQAIRAFETKRSNLARNDRVLVDIFLGYALAEARALHVIDMVRDLREMRGEACADCLVMHMNSHHTTRYAQRHNKTMSRVFRDVARRGRRARRARGLACHSPPYWHSRDYASRFDGFHLEVGRDWTWCTLVHRSPL